LIGIGSRLELQFMRWQWRPAGLKVLRIDIDPTEMVRLKPDLGVIGDAQQVAAALERALDKHHAENREAEFRAIKQKARKAIESV
jgi:acetolactate synthase I/II/III large subunit